MKSLPFAFAMVALAALPAMAIDAVPLQMTLIASKVVVQPNGGERLFPAEAVRPGDVIEYHVITRNAGSAAARNVQATLPIPAGGLEYLADAVSARTARASLDGRRFEAIPLQRAVLLASGKRALQQVPASEYRFLRWDLGDIAAGGSASVSSRMRLASASRQGAQQ